MNNFEQLNPVVAKAALRALLQLHKEQNGDQIRKLLDDLSDDSMPHNMYEFAISAIAQVAAIPESA